MLLSVGELEAARQHFEASLAAYDERNPQRSALGSDLGVFAHAWYSHALWLLGEDDAAVAHADQGIALSRRLDHLFSQTIALAYGALLHQMRGDSARVLECAEGVVALCDRYGFAYYNDWARVLIGWVRGHEQPAIAIDMIETALKQLDAQRAQARRPYYLSLLADTYRRAGERNRAGSILGTAIAMARDRSEVWWLPALLLQKSELEPAAERERTLREGLELARAQHSYGLMRRISSAMSASV
jgi:tetratricopeptide (TPR) repeat protein